MSLSFQFTAVGATQSDIEEALEIAIRQVREGFTSGHDRGDERSYSYELNNEETSVEA
jgi:hypothetical protein